MNEESEREDDQVIRRGRSELSSLAKKETFAKRKRSKEKQLTALSATLCHLTQRPAANCDDIAGLC